MAFLAVKKWKFPVIKNDKDKPSENHYNRSLLLAENGFYPVSINKQFHGGIHFDQNVLDKLGDANVRKVHCIADGEVIAYRVNDNYQKVDYGDKVGFFSTGFVLVRHLLEMDLIEKETPKAAESNTTKDNTNTKESDATANSAKSSNTDTTAKATNTSSTSKTEAKKDKKPGHRLYFYSLYMHLADTAYYDKNSKEPTPAFWEQDVYQITNKSLEFVEGLNIRHDPNKQILGVLQTGTKVNLNLEVHEDKFKWYGVSSLVDGYSSIPILKPYDYKGHQILGWVYNHSGQQLTESIFEIHPEKEDKNLTKSKGLGIKNDNSTKNISMLPKGTQIKITGEKKAGQLVELTEIVRNGQPTLPLPNTKKMVKFDGLQQIVRGKKYNEVVVLDKPFPIKAGDLVGHIGHNQNKSIPKETDKDGNYIDMETLPLGGGIKKSEFRPNLHVECFTCEDLPNYITQTQTEARKIPDKDRFFIGISKGAKLLLLNTPSDTTVGKPLEGTKIKVISKAINLKWLQIEIKIAEDKTKTLWIENSSAIEKKAIPNDDIELTENMPAWSKHPLQAGNLTSSNNIVGTSLLLNMDDDKYRAKDNRAEDEQGTLWLRIEKILDDKNMPITGWVLIGGEGVKKVSCWDWFDFKPITETASLKEFYLSVEKTLQRNKDNSSLDEFTPTIKEVLTILDKQYKSVQEKYAMINEDCFKGIDDEPILVSGLGRLLINHESEWYSELDAESKMPKWEELNSEMTENAQNVLDYLNEGDEVKCDVYIKTLDASEQESVKKGLEEARREIQRFPEDYADNPSKKLSKEQLGIYNYIKKLEKSVMVWDKTKEKAKKMLWWDDVIKGLDVQSKQKTESDTTAENKEGSNTATTSANSTPPATLSKDGKAWFIHPVSLFKFVTYQDLIDVESFLVKYESEHKNFKKGAKDKVPEFNQKSKYTLRGIIERINLFYRKNNEFKPNIYYLSYMLATARWEATWGDDVFCALFEHGSSSYFNQYDPVLASTENLKQRAKDRGNTKEGDGYTYRGRGLAHLTWKNNYKKASDYFGIDFVKDPDKAAELDNAVPILIWGSMTGGFSGHKLTTYIYKDHIGYKKARKVINGTDSADEIAAFAKRFEAILRQTSILTEEF